MIFALNAKSIYQRANHYQPLHIPTRHLFHSVNESAISPPSELVGSSDQLLSPSSIFTDHTRDSSLPLNTCSSQELKEEPKNSPLAVLYSIPKEKRYVIWSILQEYLGGLRLKPYAILLIDATSEGFQGCMLTVLSWDKYGAVDNNILKNRRMFVGESVSFPNPPYFASYSTNPPLHRSLSLPTIAYGF
jgi:hypothetical protein